MSIQNPIRFGLTGLGGYSAEIAERMLRHREGDSPLALLVAVCEPRLDRFSAQADELRRRGIDVVLKFEDLLARDVEIVWLPLPIDLHRSFTETALQAGKAVLCEKPAAGSVDDVDAMIAARDRSKGIVGIGYQDLYQPAVHELKRRLVNGEFGVVLGATVICGWPRPESYYQRNDWAGKIQREGRWILDSPANNAMAHFIHLALFFLGSTAMESAIPSEVEAELYRANPIENYDTCSLRFTFDDGKHLLANLTHACRTPIAPMVVLRTQKARIRYHYEHQIEIQTNSVTEMISLVRHRDESTYHTMHKWLREGPESGDGATLEMARVHTLAINAASEAASIVQVPQGQIEIIADAKGSPIHAIRGIEQAMQMSINKGRMLHESKAADWTQPAAEMSIPSGYSHFAGPANPS